LSPLSVEKITGLRVEMSTSYRGCIASGFSKDGTLWAEGVGNTREEALRDLVLINYVTNSEIVRERAGWRCERCGRLGATDIHHKQKRSKGRLDTIENLESICPSLGGCRAHAKEHGG
jgi:hypothetical protein